MTLFVIYCQELCSDEGGSGGVSELKNSVGEALSLELAANAFGVIDFAPVPGRGQGQLEHHVSAIQRHMPRGPEVGHHA